MTPSLSSLQAAAIIEKDNSGSVLWTWAYPSFSDIQKQFALSKCCLTWHQREGNWPTEIIPFVFAQHWKQWFYIFTAAVEEESKLSEIVSHFSIILVSKDFNPEKYAVLSRILSKTYDETGSPVPLLERYLNVITLGYCQSSSNGTFQVKNFDEKKAYMTASLKDVVNTFGIESILLYLAILLRKRVVVYHDKVELLLEFARALPSLAWHRQDWSILYPWLDDLGPLSDVHHFVAGTTQPGPRTNADLYDVYVDVPAKSIDVTQPAKACLTLGKIHKEIAKLMVEMSVDDNVTNQQLIEAIASKTDEILKKLRSLGGDAESGLSIDEIKSRNLNETTENFLINLAAAERLLQV